MPTREGEDPKIIDARTVLGLYLTQLNRFVEAKEAIDPIINFAIKKGYKRRLCQIRTIQGIYHCMLKEDFPAAYQAFEEALKISEEIKDIVSSLFANYWFGITLGYNCKFEKALLFMQRALDINISAKSLWGVSVTKGILAHFCYFYPGRMRLGFQTTAEALRMAEESGDILSKAHVYSTHGSFCLGRGLLEEAEKHLLKGIEFCTRLNESAWKAGAHLFLGQTYFEMGDFPKAKEYYEKAGLLYEHTNLLPSFMGFAKIGVAKSRLRNNEKDVDLESLYAYSRNNKIKAAEGWISGNIGETLLHIDDRHMPEAEKWIQKAIETDQRNGVMFVLGTEYALYAEWFKRKADRLKARGYLGRAIEILKECGADGWVSKYEKELALIA